MAQLVLDQHNPVPYKPGGVAYDYNPSSGEAENRRTINSNGHLRPSYLRSSRIAWETGGSQKTHQTKIKPQNPTPKTQ